MQEKSRSVELDPYKMVENYTQYGPITNSGVRARGDATVCYRTILRVKSTYLFLKLCLHDLCLTQKSGTFTEPFS